jgi:integrase
LENPDTLSGKFWQSAKRRDFNVSLHALRHTHATLLLEAKHSVKGVSQRLGHADVTLTLSVYAHVFPETAEQLGDAAA